MAGHITSPDLGAALQKVPLSRNFGVLERCGSHLAAMVGGWVMWSLCCVLGNVPPALLPAEGCFPGLCLSPKTKPEDPYPTGTHSLSRELSFAPLSQQQPEHSILWAFHSCLSRARDQRPVWGCYSKSSSTTPILVPPLSLWLLSWLCL